MRYLDKNKELYNYRPQLNGAVLTKGKRNIFLIFKSVNQGEKAKQTIANNSFDSLFKKGKKIKTLGNTNAYIKF